MAVKIDVKELYEVFDVTPSVQNIMLVGRHGIGKSRIITDYFAKKKMRVVIFFLGQMSDPGDLIGLMYKDEKTGHSEFLPPYWWPTDNKPLVLFLDELNRARPEILQSVMDLTLNKTLAGKKLPVGSIIVSAVNEGEEYQLTDLDPALVSRFNIYEFMPSVEDWLLWADRAGLDSRIVQFIQKNKHFLDADNTSKTYQDGFFLSLTKSPDRRAWERVSDMLKPVNEITEIHIKTIAGIVGMQAAMALKKSLDEFMKVTVEQILLEFEKYKNKLKDLKLQEFVFLNEQIMFWINGEHFNKTDKKLMLNNLNSYLLSIKKLKMNEALAHFASMLENVKFSRAASIILVDSPDIMQTIEDYIGNINL